MAKLNEKRLSEINQIKNHDVIGQSKDKNLIPYNYKYIYDSFQIGEKPNVEVFIKELFNMKSAENVDNSSKWIIEYNLNWLSYFGKFDMAKQELMTNFIIDVCYPIVRAVKSNYSQMRPIHLAEEIGLTFDPLIETPRSSSYPSGTATAIHCIALFVNKLETTSKKDHQKNLQISRKLAYILRVDGGVHYPIDMIYGQELALHIVEQFLKKYNNPLL